MTLGSGRYAPSVRGKLSLGTVAGGIWTCVNLTFQKNHFEKILEKKHHTKMIYGTTPAAELESYTILFKKTITTFESILVGATSME